MQNLFLGGAVTQLMMGHRRQQVFAPVDLLKKLHQWTKRTPAMNIPCSLVEVSLLSTSALKPVIIVHHSAPLFFMYTI